MPRQRKELSWIKQAWIPWTIFAVVSGILLSVAYVLFRAASEHHEAHFALAAREQLVVLEMGVHVRFRPVQHLSTVIGLQNGNVDRRSFLLFAQSIPLEKPPALVAMQWIAREQDASGKSSPSVRYSYDPVNGRLVAPTAAPPADLMQKALSQRELVVGPWFVTDGQVLFWALSPVFHHGPGEPALLGFVSGLYQVKRLITDAFCSVESDKATDAFVSDPTSDTKLFFSCLGASGRAVGTKDRPPKAGHHFTRTIPINSAGWIVTVIARHGTFEASGWIPVSIGVLGLILGTTLAGLYRVLIAREEQVQRLVVRRTEQLEAANRELENFTSIASHDLKAPLRAISQLSSWIQEDVSDQLDEENRNRLRLMRERAIRMDHLIEGLLTYSRAGRVTGDVTVPVPLRPLLEEAIAELPLPDGFRVEIADPLPALRADGVHLRQIFQNLIANAAFHHDHPTTGKVRIHAEEEERFWRIELADDGPGIPPEERERVFEMFTSLRPEAGQTNTGIGLTIVRKLVLSYGGRVDIVENPPRGARFRIWWPK